MCFSSTEVTSHWRSVKLFKVLESAAANHSLSVNLKIFARLKKLSEQMSAEPNEFDSHLRFTAAAKTLIEEKKAGWSS